VAIRSKMSKYTEKDEYIKSLEGLIKYQYAYDILMEHFNEFHHETRKKIDKELTKLNL